MAEAEGKPSVEGWVLCGGEGRRMGGQDKGLIEWQGVPLALHVARRLAPQVAALQLNANRHLPEYRAWGWPVHPDDPDLPRRHGPLAGILTGWRHTRAPWMQLAPCDTPTLPPDLTQTLWRAARANNVLIAVPFTPSADGHERRHHWTCALAHRDTHPALEGLVGVGEARVGLWIQSQPWIGVCFEDPGVFTNFNTLETLHGKPPA